MLSMGIYIVNEKTYTIHEINEPGFYRIDFIREGGDFQTDVNAVAYSQVHKKKTYTIGDSDLYDDYLKFKENVSNAKLKSTQTSTWEDGEFVVRTQGSDSKTGYSSTSVKRNGELTESTLQGAGRYLHFYVADPVYGIKLEPMNFDEYEVFALVDDREESKALFHSIDYLKRKYNISHIDSMDVCVATTLDKARERLRDFDTNPCLFRGFDTETTGVDVTMYGEDVMVGIVLGHDDNTATYFPFRHKGDFNLPMSFLDELMQVVLKHQDKLVAHNGKFDRQVMLKEGYDLVFKWDTMLISIILNPILAKGAHALKTLMLKLNGLEYLELVNIFINSKDIDFSVLPVEIIHYYACTDASSVITLLKDQLKKLPKYQYKLALLECDLSAVKADMEYYGIRVDVKKYEQQYKNCNYIIETLLNAFRILTKEDGNINSQQVLTSLLYDRMHCKVLMRTPKGLPSTSSAAIKKLAKVKADKPHPITEDITDLYGNVVIKAKDLANSKYPALLILAKYREYNKLKTAFYARFERTMKTGRVFFWINQNGAATGRQSSPMHQLPPALKEVILSDADDRDFWGPDFSQIELRMIAYLAGEKELIDLASDPENDIHRIIGSLITGKEMWAITPEERSVGKRRNFGVVYLISAMGLAGQIFGPGYTTENVEFCQQQLDDFYKHFKRIDRYIKENGRKVQKYGYMSTAWYNRRRLFTEIFDPNLEPRKRASIIRMANNVPVQGTAADYLKLAEVQMYNYIKDKGWNKLHNGFPLVRMMLSIHDEIIISAHQSIPCEEITEMITNCMQIPVEGAPPFFVQPARMTSWADHSDDSVAMPIPFRDDIIKKYKETGVSQFKHSYFKLVIPADVKAEIDKALNDNVKSLCSKYYEQCSLEFMHGDYTKEYTKEHVKAALLNYIESDRTVYRIDNYRILLKEFRDAQLADYMKGLIQEYGTDYTIVGEKVRHPSLTHTLLDVYSDELKGKDLTHEERITEATKLYIEDLLNNAKDVKQSFIFNLNTDNVKVTDKDLFTEQLEASVNFDADGNIIYEEEDAEEDDVYSAYYDDPDPEGMLKQIDGTPKYVWELGDAVTFDVQHLVPEDINKILTYIFEHSQKDGFYKTYLIWQNKLVDTSMRMENIDVEEANNIVLKLGEERYGAIVI